MYIHFYHKPKKSIEPIADPDLNLKAKQRLAAMYEDREKLEIPDKFIQNWEKVALYDVKGDVDNANSLLIESDEGAYNLGNKINDLTGKEWIKFTCSWFIFNAIKDDLKQERELDQSIDDHPATYSPTMISDFINFFTKKNAKVLDPFLGIGSTLEACVRTGRVGFGTELNQKYFQLCKKRAPQFSSNIYNDDARNIPSLNIPKIDFCISSPPYWDILNRSTGSFKSTRDKKNLDVNYSEHDLDLGNIDDYEKFIEECSKVYLNIYEVLKNNAYIVIILKNVKKGGKLYPLAWDLARSLSSKYVLKDEKIWIQDKIALAPYGYPYSWTSNILHTYCLILRKEE